MLGLIACKKVFFQAAIPAIQKCSSSSSLQVAWSSSLQEMQLHLQMKNSLASNASLRYRLGMMICLANTKGGVGKSTIAVHLAVWLHDQGFKTALLDADKQRSSSQWISEAEKGITLRVSEDPDSCASEALALTESHDFVVGDGPGGLDSMSRTMLIFSDLALLPISPSILDLRSVQQATEILRYAQKVNRIKVGLPEGRLILNKMRTRETISKELQTAAPGLGVSVARTVIRDLQAYRDAAQQGTTVTRMGRKSAHASDEISRLFAELLPNVTRRMTDKEAANG